MARTRRRVTRREIKEDRFILWVFEAGEFARENVQAIVIGVAVVIISISAGYLWSNQKASNLSEAGRVMAPGQTAMQSNRFDDAIPIFERVKSDYSGTPVAAEATIQLAKAYFLTDQFDKARAIYSEYLDSYGGDDEYYTLSAKSGIAACDEQEGKYAEAAQTYLELAENDTDSFLTPKFLLDAGRCFQAADQIDKAKELYDRIVTTYESTRYARDAKLAMTMM